VMHEDYQPSAQAACLIVQHLDSMAREIEGVLNAGSVDEIARLAPLAEHIEQTMIKPYVYRYSTTIQRDNWMRAAQAARVALGDSR